MTNSTDFVRFCRHLYGENCYERLHHGQKPYENFDLYFTKNKEWLKEKYGSRERNQVNI